ncbi:MAG: beta-galactosidase [Thermoguttaceae bacterium]|nr:beta-galactosidase [Thermoguttaceae bacterium]
MKTRSFIFLALPTLIGLALCSFSLSADDSPIAGDTPSAEDSPYGVCAHISFGDEQLDKKLRAIREAGIRFVRADFTWSAIEYPRGTWNFEKIDATMAEMDKYGLKMLPILYYPTDWSRPTAEHLDCWEEYIRTVVSRYQDRIRFWEIWNEENLDQFWFAEPNPADYAKVLTAAGRVIHQIDPELKVIYGGTSGIPQAYIEESFKAGALEGFDVMAIHPYREGLGAPGADSGFIRGIESLRSLLERYGDGDRPIWITEMGWASLPDFDEIYSSFPLAALRALGPEKAAVLDDRAYPHSRGGEAVRFYGQVASLCPTESITLEQLKNLSPDQFHTLVLPPGESFPAPCFERIRDFVRDGGTLILSGGVPFYAEEYPDESGIWREKPGWAPEDYRRAMRIGWKASWTAPGTPDFAPVEVTETLSRAAPDAEALRRAAERMRAGRFYTDALLKEGDEMIVLAYGVAGDFRGACSVIYRFNSDWKGRILITGGNPLGVIVNQTDQARFLASAILLARCASVEKFFWYELQSPECDPVDKESHFGLTHADISPKPAYFAYQALIRAVGEGAADFRRDTVGDIEQVRFRRADGRLGWAVWAPGRAQKARLSVAGSVTEAFDYLGNPVSLEKLLSDEGGSIEQRVIYIIGPEEVTVHCLDE